MDPKNILKDANKFKQFTQHVFNQFDKNGNGSVEVSELKNALVQFAKEAILRNRMIRLLRKQ